MSVMRPTWAPSEVDLSRPSQARMYDYFLGGEHNFAIDREVARRAIDLLPDLPMIMRANRAFLRRAVRFCVAQGITQFIDLGSGIPTVANVHEVAQEQNPDCRVVYVDNDPIAVTHSEAMLVGNGRAAAIQADLRNPRAVLVSPEVRSLIDLDQPVALLMLAVLHFMPDSEEPYRVVSEYRDAVAEGSYLAISHASFGTADTTAQDRIDLMERAGLDLVSRSSEEISEFFSGFSLVEPGLARLPLWRPDSVRDLAYEPERFAGLVGVGYKV
ncbi:SAM-dependent methyltransferase [Allokutzneria oryzae]|uniref:SAM-dependent methyltransferase n=1 Tax=Allokutzneria oryzae TaxID=1378989 RepID=A0ABV6A3Q7_9PSEU